MAKWFTRLVLGKDAVEPDPSDELRELTEPKPKPKSDKQKKDGER